MQQYTVCKGDTLERIAARRGLSKAHIINANPWAEEQPYLLPGQIIFLPSSPRRRYVIQPGDSLDQVAEAFQVQEASLLEMNPGISGSYFPEGRMLVLPHTEKNRIVELKGEYGYQQLTQDIRRLTQSYPRIAGGTIGESVLGKPIPYLRIGEGARIIHVNASIHANEWITTPCIMRFIEDYAYALKEVKRWNGYDPRLWFAQCTLWVVPMVNPDGVELVQEGIQPNNPYYEQLTEWNGGRIDYRHWKANLNGVDLGDQFPAHWEEEVQRRGKKSPGPKDYAGVAPLSEPEAAALAAFTVKTSPDAAVSLHSQGQEIYWNYRNYEPKESREMSRRLGQASGYRPVKLEGSDAGYKDWFIQEFRRPGFTVEIGLGKNPLPLDDFENVALETGLVIAELLSI
ncbi:LysM peptidoglycan-binding domain-containing protein [Paenibacillus sp. KQZ6P-2]|uniref:LysM peptidoglycan-binding domain-containing protein n=1 Tax=Paenibacillus mangrovi TaxID=2931978 RepID=A0A9X1WRH1_9BACL|nr:M14 family metallopeptidase [Paenibacillus mangrovi]MCJ8010339.1 LysM peptidoglycan-binding domain-containing protein [Paenibacillus mangrovi]